jgi:sugar phosphate isomerase/epimerase
LDEHKGRKPCLKGCFPFRLGATSYIIPDDILPNIEFLGPLVDDVELVLFESEEISNLPDPETLARWNALRIQHRLTFTVHLPLDIQLGSSDEGVRKKSVDQCLRIIDLCGSLSPFGYVLHFHGDQRGKNPSGRLVDWRAALTQSTRELLNHGVAPDLICVETLDYPFGLVADIVLDHNLSVCLDVGHLAFFQYSLPEHLEKYWNRTRVVHLHGNENGTDHKDIGLYDRRLLQMLLDRLNDKPGGERVLTLEIFNEKDLARSLDIMETFAL